MAPDTSATTPITHTVMATCEGDQASAVRAAERLRSWALIRGATIAGPAFLRLRRDGGAEVHLPTKGCAAPHPETGLRPDVLVGELHELADQVPFDSAAALLAAEWDSNPEYDDIAFGDFYPADRSFGSGVLKVRRPWCDAARPPASSEEAAPERPGRHAA